MVAFHPIPVVSRENCCVVRGSMDQIPHDRHQGGFQVAVQVSEMQKTKTFKGWRQIWKKPFPLFQTDIQKISPHPLFDPGKVQDAREPQVERQEAFYAENAASLVNEFREFVLLSLEPLGVELIAQAGSQCGRSQGGMDQGFLVAGGMAWRRGWKRPVSPSFFQ